ncbi:MAG: AAA family ATPase [Myxococcales bacterium]|nr:AAA family ATPase [Myxococcales bacterium]USN50740.1 MAG: AAA family ATPase [Myxococcales bacterium]
MYCYHFPSLFCLFSLLISLLFSCSASHKNITSQQHSFLSSATDGAIALLPHQQFVVDYLNNNPHIKGLLINHYMGTGKTFLALGYAEQHQQDQVIILGPPYLKNNWHQQIDFFNVANKKRYNFISFEDAIKQTNTNIFDKKILIIDEVHNLIRHLNTDNENENQKYAKLLLQTRQASRVLGLTGTPIYQDVSDIALLLNLVSQEDLLPFNREEFRTNYSKKIPSRSFWRGKLFESNIFYLTLPVFFSFLSFALFATPLAIIPGAALGASIIPLTNTTIAPLTHYQLREGDYAKLTPYIEKYVSFFRFENPSSEDFPSRTVQYRQVPYSTAQMDFFLRYIEEDLRPHEIIKILQENQEHIDTEYVAINNSRINKNLKLVQGNGREIGNFSLPNASDTPPKFNHILSEIKQSPGKIGIFSNYDFNGIKKFYDFLCSHDLCKDAVLIDPKESDAIQEQKINQYNTDKKSIILFTFSEGVNLFKTRQLHILEPVLTPATLEQVMGRAVRYRSHAKLLPEQRHVDVFVWQSTLPSWDWKSYQLKRKNWMRRYGELSRYSDWGKGASQIDKNYDAKIFSPDTHTFMASEKLRRDSSQIIQTLQKHSIETRP